MECDYLRGLSVTLSTLASCSNVQIAPESLALYIYIYINKLNYIVQIHIHILALVCILCIQLSAQGWVTSRVSSTCRNDRLQTTATATTTNKLQIQQQDEAESQQAQLTLIRLSLALLPSSSDLCLMTTTKLPTFRSISICLFSGQFDFFFFLFFFANCSYQNQVNALLALFVDQFGIVWRFFFRRNASTI